MWHEDVRTYYDGLGEREWARLTRQDDGMVEYAINCRTIATYLRPGMRILDIGGGPGRYSLWLAEQGHRVVLADLSSELLAIARDHVRDSPHSNRVEEIVEADACNLSRWPDGSFDAVLSLGPFYYLPETTDRDRAASELARVLSHGGIAFVALMPRYAFLRRILANPVEHHLLRQPDFLERLLGDGIFINDRPGAFTAGYGALTEEIAPFFEHHGFTTLTLLSSESVVPDLQNHVARLSAEDPLVYHAAVDAIVRVAADPSILGMGNHLLYVGQIA